MKRTRRIAIVIPCHNEEATVATVVRDFLEQLPDAEIIVVDNASTDSTPAAAEAAGARVVYESRLGKGFALSRGLGIARDADLVVMVDGDATYPADEVHALIAATERKADIAIGTRLDLATDGAFRRGHNFGNRLFNALVKTFFGVRTRDLFSGYRVMTRRFLSASPLIAQGFEIETELSLQALVGGFRVEEIPVRYRARPSGTHSKLRTIRDGYRILLALVAFFRDYRPLTLFGLIGIFFLLLAFMTGAFALSGQRAMVASYDPVLAILATGFGLLGALAIIAGLILSSIARRSTEITTLLARLHSED